MNKLTLWGALIAGALTACTPSKTELGEVDAYVPVYASVATAKTISAQPARAITNAGKIVALGNTLFQVEVGAGVHVINMANPSSPQKLVFIEIAGCNEMSIKNGFVFANNFNDLVVVNISNLASPDVVKRIDNAFPQALTNYPPQRNVYFECPDAAKGLVIGWTLTKVKNPKCRR
jgi:hypothetical protein